MPSCRATICLASQRHGGTAHATGVLQRMGTGSVGRPGQEGEARELPFTREPQEHVELCHAMDDEPAKSLWVRIRGQANVVLSVSYKPTDQEEI